MLVFRSASCHGHQLTAYVAAIHGWLAAQLLPAAVALGASAGHETPAFRAFARGSVLLMDVLLLVPAVCLMARLLTPSPLRRWSLVALALAQPTLVRSALRARAQLTVDALADSC